jgi:methylmalonyl-CoA mutase, N-terminal domain
LSALSRLSVSYEQWPEAYGLTAERETSFTALSGEPIKPLDPERDLPDPDETLGLPGEFPFTRGVYRLMYRGLLWTLRQLAGFGTAEEM